MPSCSSLGVFQFVFHFRFRFGLNLQVRDVIRAAVFQRDPMIHDVVVPL
jgi:hypothetical protein